MSALLSLSAEKTTLAELPENWETRQRYVHYIQAPISRLNELVRQRHTQKLDGRTVHFQVQRQNNDLFLLFIAEDPLGRVDQIKRGNVSIKRSLEDGRFEYFTVMLRNHPGCYARVYPIEERTFMDVVMFNTLIYSKVKMPMTFDTALLAPFSQLYNIASGIVDWDMVFYTGKNQVYLSQHAQAIRSYLPNLPDGEDGAFDGNGNPVFIETVTPAPPGLNCSGFAKWVVDGFYFPANGKYLEIESLKSKSLTRRGNRWSLRYEDERDPFFGLDWTRNLALLSDDRVQSKDDGEKNDVRDVEFFSYIEDVGYSVKDLEFMMFLLAQKYPDHIFLGSLNRPYGSEPVLRQHHHVAVLLPLFGPEGDFSVDIYERNTPIDLDSFTGKYMIDHIHLVRVRADREFQPLIFTSEP